MMCPEEVNIIDNESLPDDQKPSGEENKEKSRLFLGVGLAFVSSLLFTICGLILKQVTINVSDILGNSQTSPSPHQAYFA